MGHRVDDGLVHGLDVVGESAARGAGDSIAHDEGDRRVNLVGSRAAKPLPRDQVV